MPFILLQHFTSFLYEIPSSCSRLRNYECSSVTLRQVLYCFREVFHVPLSLLQLSRSVILTCTSEGYDIVLAILLIYKCIYLCVGLLFAFETRKVNIEALNDARFIGLSVYCCVLTCIPLVPIGILLSSQQQARYGVLAGGIFFAVTVILCLLFVPKVKDRLKWRVGSWGGRDMKLACMCFGVLWEKCLTEGQMCMLAT